YSSRLECQEEANIAGLGARIFGQESHATSQLTQNYRTLASEEFLMNLRKNIILWMYAAMVALILPAAVGAQEVMKWNIDGVERRAIVYAPSAVGANGKAPLVFAFHGHGGNAQGFSRSVNMQTAWPHAIVVYPQGVPTDSKRDPEGLHPGWQRDAGQDGDRDL